MQPGTASPANPYIVVLDVAVDIVRALLFDLEARRVEGYAAQLPRRADAVADCLDEMHRLVHADGFRIAAVVGRAENEVTAEDRSYWPAFEGAKWFPSLPEGAGMILGCGCVDKENFALVIGSASMIATVVGAPLSELPASLTCTPIDDKRWLLAGAVPEADLVIANLKRALKAKSLEAYLETADDADPQVVPLDGLARHFLECYNALLRTVGKPSEVIGFGGALLKSGSLTRRIADGLHRSLTLCTEPEPACRGAALWALERVGAIESLRALPASVAALFHPRSMEIIK